MFMRRLMTVPRFFFAAELPQTIAGKTHNIQDTSHQLSPILLQADTLVLFSQLPPKTSVSKP